MKEKLKVYHGLPKTPTNENTLFYASFDGTFTPEIHTGSFTKTGGERSFSPNITGYGLNPLNGIKSEITYEIPTYTTTNLPEVSTVDLWAYYPGHIGKLTRFIYAMFCDILVHEDGYLYVGFWRNRVKVRTLEQGYYHFRLVIKTVNKSTGETDVDLYINGRKEGTYKTTVSDVENPPATISFGHMNDSYVCAVSDVHVTLDDLGDYFPTLPQDFIDGKAIVVPALNQRQSYGDPVLHQVTELLVKSQPMEVLGTIYDLNDVDSDGLERCFNNPELRTANAHTWEATWGKIRITGLDNTFITGVIDTDTAKCRVTSSTGLSDTITISVDNTSGLVVGDRLWVYDYTMTNLWNTDPNYYIEVKAIDSVNKTITVQSNSPHGISVMAGDLLIETTASSSSPVVKTVDGATVNGTWSGLGTQQVTFTLGSNSNIAGKDLIVTYCLNAKGNSSPYPKMPSEVIRGYDELGNEMTPVTDLIFKDNLQNKTQGNTKICPHKVYWQNSISINEFIGSELDSNSYALINSPSDYYSYSAMPREYAMIIAEVDVIALIESKIGQKIPGNKYNWIINNVNSIRCHATCRGNTGSENYIEIRYRTKNGQFNLNSSSSCKHTSMDFKEIYATGGTELLNSDCKIMFALVTKHSSDVVIPTAEVKDFRFEVVFKTSEIYNYLANSDMWSRTGTVVNPILVDKQTKEVKRLVPSNAPFSTQVIVHNPTLAKGDVGGYREACKGNFVFLTTLGTGKTTPISEPLRGCIGNLDVTNNHLYMSEDINSLVLSNKAYKFCTRHPQIGLVSANEFSVEDAPQTNYLAITYDLIESNNVLYLKALIEHLNYKSRSGAGVRFYEIPNRPLIK